MKIRSIVSLIIMTCLFTVIMGTYFVTAWYIDVSVNDGAVILSDPVEGLEIQLFRGYDYDLNGSIDENLKNSRNKKDLNESYLYLTDTDEVDEIYDNNLITYRLVVSNESSYEIDINPYFMYDKSIKVNSILYRIDSLAILNHTMRKQDGSTIIDYDDRAILNGETFTGDYKKYALSNGLFDTFGKPIYHITDGTILYSFTYSYDEETKLYSCTEVRKDGEVVNNETIDLTYYFISDIYNDEGVRLEAGNITEAYSSTNYEYNYLSDGYEIYEITDPTEYNYYLYPSRMYFPNNCMNLFMHEEYYSDSITLESYSEYYIDLVLRASSAAPDLYDATEAYALKYGGVYDNENKTYDFSNSDYQDEYDAMYDIYLEKITNSTLSNIYADENGVVFKVRYFCYDVKIGTEFDSYTKPAYKKIKLGEGDD